MIIDVNYRLESTLFGTLYFPSKDHLGVTLRNTSGLPGHRFQVYEKLLRQEDGTFPVCKGPFEVHYGTRGFSSAVIGPIDSLSKAVEVYDDLVRNEFSDFSNSEIWRKVDLRMSKSVKLTLDGEAVSDHDDPQQEGDIDDGGQDDS